MVEGMEIGSGGRRERKKLATHVALRAAALRLVAERGLHQVTVEDIAEAADVSVRTFFNYFPSKEDAIVGLDPEKADLLREALVSRPPEEPPLGALRAVLGDLGTAMVERSEEWSLRLAVVKGSPALLPRFLASFATYERALVEGVAARIGVDPDSDLYPTVVVEASIGALRAALGMWRTDEGARPLPDLMGQAFGHLAAGLAQPERRAGRTREERATGAAEGRRRVARRPKAAGNDREISGVATRQRLEVVVAGRVQKASVHAVAGRSVKLEE